MKQVILLGASGSIGTQSLDVLYQHQDQYQLIGISVYRNYQLALQILPYFPTIKYLALKDKNDCQYFKDYPHLQFFYEDTGIKQLINQNDDAIIIDAICGFAGVIPCLNALEANKTVLLANKESLVCCGHLINNLLNQGKGKLIPIDSEHSAIMQCLKNEDINDVKHIILTASGGSFRDYQLDELTNVTLSDVLKHPTWQMGANITIDSATMFNKALEIIEAHYLFNIAYDKIKVLMHYESLNHSMVEFIDGSCLAQLSFPDMRIAINYALSYPKRIPLNIKKDIMLMQQMHFKPVDLQRFVAIKIAYEIGKLGNTTYQCVLNASKEAANELFIAQKISFLQITDVVIDALKNHFVINDPDLDTIIAVDQQTRQYVYHKWS